MQTEQSCNDKDSVSDTEDCKLCDYYSDQQGKQLFLHYPPVLIISLPATETLNTHVVIGNYKFTLQGFTNKGPPTPLV